MALEIRFFLLTVLCLGARAVRPSDLKTHVATADAKIAVDHASDAPVGCEHSMLMTVTTSDGSKSACIEPSHFTREGGLLVVERFPDGLPDDEDPYTCPEATYTLKCMDGNSLNLVKTTHPDCDHGSFDPRVPRLAGNDEIRQFVLADYGLHASFPVERLNTRQINLGGDAALIASREVQLMLNGLKSMEDGEIIFEPKESC
eukprot:gnl/TRDRNA2_/TRDRNA2_132757_c0_seq2.p1 gnl/TRDRNA2_/TRDRNA2_132757_c0~~gnl/TRDRNA2_/TRDRNA2_132757_c0_seq2.p1  ORF type:complete len:217 (+),score=27.45 gnl/TRDRNA2_/TRDRNA2_132757_c0_seq2:46-651(+)